MSHTREDLNAMTAKALRPIAADLGITGASRMAKAAIVEAILLAVVNANLAADLQSESVKAERETAHAEALEIHAERETDIKRDREVAEDLGLIELPTAECNSSKPGYASRVDEIKAMRAGVLESVETAHTEAVETAHTEAVVLDQDRSIYRWVTDLSGEEASAPTDWSAVAAYADERRPHFTPEQWAGIAVKAEDDNTREYPAKVEAPKTLPTFVRRTRTGRVEQVVVTDVRDGRVHYRHAENGRLSPARYNMREASFSERYTPVSR